MVLVLCVWHLIISLRRTFSRYENDRGDSLRICREASRLLRHAYFPQRILPYSACVPCELIVAALLRSMIGRSEEGISPRDEFAARVDHKT